MTLPEHDAALLAELGDAVRGEVSARARANARGAFAWRTVEEDLMRLAHDSWSFDASDQTAVRGGGQASRVVGFQAGAFTLEVEIDGETLMGQVVPARRCQITVVTPTGEPVEVDTDASGIFSVSTPPGPLVRFTVAIGDERQTTQWLPL